MRLFAHAASTSATHSVVARGCPHAQSLSPSTDTPGPGSKLRCQAWFSAVLGLREPQREG